ncbi:MAG: dienelactone hydrolase family protein [Mycobacteriales bacterium]
MTETKLEHFGDFDRREVTLGGDTKQVYVSGTGPAVVVMTEFPGITPDVARFARWVRDAGFTVWLPSLFGRDGAPPTLELAGETMRAGCVRREFAAFAAGGPSPMAGWLRLLAAHAHQECGGPGVGAVGMCFTGNFALSMMLEPAVLAPVLSQPSLPLDQPDRIFMSDEEVATIRDRLERDDLTVLGLRFAGDPYCQAGRFETYQRHLGKRFVPTVLADNSAGDLGWIAVPHSVLTTSLRDGPNEPTTQVRDAVITFLVAALQA